MSWCKLLTKRYDEKKDLLSLPLSCSVKRDCLVKSKNEIYGHCFHDSKLEPFTPQMVLSETRTCKREFMTEI